jgi:hypothetical protein
MARDRARNNLSTARLLGVTTTPKTIQDFVGLADKDDMYRFKIGTNSSLDLRLSGIAKKANVDISLYTLKGARTGVLRRIGKIDFSNLKPSQIRRFLTRVGRSVKPGNRSEALNLPLNPGEYFLQVHRRSGDTAYKLTLSATPVITPTPAPNTGGTPTPTPTPGVTPTPTPTPGVTPTPTPTPITASWVRQLGGNKNDYSYDVAADGSGKVYVVGTTESALTASANAGKTDSFIAQYDGTGTAQWVKQVGTANDDGFSGVAVSGSNIYAAGARNVVLPSLNGLSLNPGSGDAHLVKYDEAGNQVWSRTYDAGGIDAAAGVATDSSNNIYIAGASITVSLSGLTPNVQVKQFVRKFDSSGNTVALSGNINNITTNGAISGIAVDATGNIYVTGITYTSVNPLALLSANSSSLELADVLTGENVFVTKYGSNGNQIWSATIASTNNQDDYARGIALDAQGNVYVTGDTTGTLPSGSLPANTNVGNSIDAFIAKLDANGIIQWTKQFGTTGQDQGQSIAVDSAGNPYIAGEISGSAANLGSQGFFSKYSSDGSQLFQQQIGTSADDEAYAISVDGTSSVYVAGQTLGALGGTNAGQYDVFVTKYPPA